ncbi:hemerythrin domain-containing protein [Angustibacter speluncae]
MADTLTHGETMNRLIHVAVRRDLDRFSAAVETFTPGDAGRAEALGEAFAHFDQMLTSHHEGEEKNLWPVIGDPGAGHQHDVADLTDEHEEIVRGLGDSRDAFAALRTSAAADDAARAAAGLDRLRDAATTHFAHEESQMHELLGAADPEAVSAALRRMGRDAPLAEALWFVQWVSDSLDPAQRRAFGEVMPAPLRALSSLLAGRRYRRVTAAAFG